MDTMKQTNEDSESRALRSNEYSLHTSNSAPAPVKKVRLKNKATGATVGIFDNHKLAATAHANHPLKHKLFIEGVLVDKHELVRDLMEARQDIPVVESKSTLKFSEYRAIFEEQEEILEAKIEEKKQLLLGGKKKTVNDIELDENAFNWQKPIDKRPDWDKAEDKPKAVKPAVDPNAPKRGRGRPAGSYGKYKVAGRSDADKAAIGSKVHSNPERKAKYDDAIAARKEFKSLMNKAIAAKEKTPK